VVTTIQLATRNLMASMSFRYLRFAHVTRPLGI
jgi:hypothetical protein